MKDLPVSFIKKCHIYSCQVDITVENVIENLLSRFLDVVCILENELLLTELICQLSQKLLFYHDISFNWGYYHLIACLFRLTKHTMAGTSPAVNGWLFLPRQIYVSESHDLIHNEIYFQFSLNFLFYWLHKYNLRSSLTSWNIEYWNLINSLNCWKIIER